LQISTIIAVYLGNDTRKAHGLSQVAYQSASVPMTLSDLELKAGREWPNFSRDLCIGPYRLTYKRITTFGMTTHVRVSE